MRSCESGGLDCGFGEVCRPVPPGGGGSGRACVVTACSESGAGSCDPGFVCNTTPSADRHGFPSIWIP